MIGPDSFTVLSASSTRPLLADGAIGSYALSLFPKGSRVWEGRSPCIEQLNILCPSAVTEIHSSYLASGSQIIHTNTTCGDGIMLQRSEHADFVRKVNMAAAACARIAVTNAGGRALIAGALGPSYIDPKELQTNPQVVAHAYGTQIEALLESGVDLLWIETARNHVQTRLLLEVIASEQGRMGISVPVILTLSPSSGGAFPPAFSELELHSLLQEHELMAVGMNCGFGISEISRFLESLGSITDLPFVIAPSAGIPQELEGSIVYPTSADLFVDDMKTLISKFHPIIVGGCCGTTPEYIGIMQHAIMRNASATEHRV